MADSRTSEELVAAPVRLRVPSIGVDSTLLLLGLDDEGVLEVPEDPDLAGCDYTLDCEEAGKVN